MCVSILKRSLLVTLFGGLALLSTGCVALVPFIESDVVLGPDGRVVEVGKACGISGVGDLPPSVTTELSYFAPSVAPAPELKPEVVKPLAPRVAPRRKLSKREIQQRKFRSLVKQLRNPSDVVRTHAASDLGILGAKATPAIQPLAYALENDSSKWVRRAAARSLGKIGDRAAVRPLRRALKDRNKWVAHSAQNSLRKIRH